MGFNSVYRSLVEIFPQIDARILRAVAIEHPKDYDEAVEVVLSEIVPFLPSNSARNFTGYQNKSSGYTGEAERERENGELRRHCAHMVSVSNCDASSSGTLPLVVDCGNDTSSGSTELMSHLNKVSNVPLNGGSSAFETCAGNEEFVSRGNAPEKDYLYHDLSGSCFHSQDDQMDKDLPDQKDSVARPFSKCSPVPHEVKTPVIVGEHKAKVATSIDSFLASAVVAQENITLTGNGGQDCDGHIAGTCISVGNKACNQPESSSSTSSQNAVLNLVDLDTGEHATNAQQCSGSSNIAHETSNGSVTSENGDAESSGAFSNHVKRLSEACNIDYLEEIIEDAKNNKKILFAVMESVMNLMREVELQEKDAEKAKEESARGGIDTLNKVDELKKMLEHAREANDMHAGEVYGEKSILATEVKELENRLLNLSEERDASLAILDEMREILEVRLAAALEMKKVAEQEKQGKEDKSRKALAEQEAIMEKVVQESKLLQHEAEENSKLREFLMDRGRVVDSLQGEISVICQDVRLLKENFDERVPLSQSISSSQTSCRLASSASSSVNLLDKSTEPSYEKHVIPNDDESPSTSLNKTRDDDKELLEEGWDIC